MHVWHTVCIQVLATRHESGVSLNLKETSQ
jgi:hypothetical protein